MIIMAIAWPPQASIKAATHGGSVPGVPDTIADSQFSARRLKRHKKQKLNILAMENKKLLQLQQRQR